MTLVQRVMKNSGWCLAYFGTTIFFGICLMWTYSLILDDHNKIEGKIAALHKRVDDYGVEFWRFVEANAKDLSKVKDESDPFFVTAQNLLAKGSERVYFLLGEKKNGKRELLLYTDFCYNYSQLYDYNLLGQPCSRAIKLIDQAPLIDEFNIGLAEHAPQLSEQGVFYDHKFHINNSKVKYSVSTAPLCLTLFHTGLATEKEWDSSAKYQNYEDYSPSNVFLSTQLGERVFRLVKPVVLKPESNPDSKNADFCSPGHAFREAVISVYHIQKYQKVSNERHAHYRKSSSAKYISDLSWGKHMTAAQNHFEKFDE